jgi:hypothetical protein
MGENVVQEITRLVAFDRGHKSKQGRDGWYWLPRGWTDLTQPTEEQSAK